MVALRFYLQNYCRKKKYKFPIQEFSTPLELTKPMKQKKVPHCCGTFYLEETKNYFFSVFSILAFKAANTSLLSPKVAAGAFVVDADEVFSVAAFTFFSSSSRKIAV